MKLAFHFNRSLSRVLAPGDRRLWLLRCVALRIEQQANPVWRFEIYHRRLALVLATLALVGWLTAATALFAWLNRVPHNQVGWLDLAAPWRWSGLRTKRGDTAVLAALDEIKAKDFAAAFYNLRVGLSRSPGNVDGRIVLAQLMAGGEPARALALMEEGIPLSASDPKFLAGLLNFYTNFQIQAHALEVVDGLLARTPALPAEARLLLARARVDLLLQLGRPADAEAAFAALPAPDTAESRASHAALEIDLRLRTGHPAEARQVLDRALAAGLPLPSPTRLEVEVAVAAKDAEALRRALIRLKNETPERPGVYLLAIQSWQRINRPGYRDAAEEEYYNLFAGNDGALQALGALAVNLDLPDVLNRVQRVAVRSRLSDFAYRVHQTELALRRGDLEGATRQLQGWENSIETLQVRQRFHPELIKRLTRAAFAGTPEQSNFLLAHLATGRGLATLSTYLLASTVLEQARNLSGAAEVLKVGRELFPQSDPLRRAQDRVAALLTAQPVVAKTEEPAAAAPKLVLLPGNAGEARQQLDRLVRDDALIAARDQIRAIRRQKPDWLAEIEPDLAVREVELAYLALDQIASRTLVRGYLGNHRAEAEVLTLVPVVQRLAARGRLAEARLLQEEIEAAAGVTVRVRQALSDLNLGDDLSAEMENQAAAVAALDRSIQRQQWAQAERLLKRLRDKPPAWLAAAATELKVREVQIRLGLDQRPLALGALKDLVIKGGAPRAAAFKLVRDLLAAGQADTALLLAREIVRLSPDDAIAARLLQEAEAPRPGGP